MTQERFRSKKSFPDEVAPNPSRSGSRTLWKEIRTLIDRFVQSRVSGLPDSDKDEIIRGFEMDLQLVLNDLQRRIIRIRRDQYLARESAERADSLAINDACATLGVDPPTVNMPLDVVTVKRNYRRLARLYHPDSNGGDVSQLSNYRSVVSAYRTIDDYLSRKS